MMETKITLVPNRFKLSLLPSYIMLFVSDEAWLFIFQGNFDKGSQHEQLLLLSCTALCIYDRDSYYSVCFIYLLQLHRHSIISFMIFLYSVAPFCIPYFITCTQPEFFRLLTYRNPNIITDWLFIRFNFIYVLKVRWFHNVFNKLSVLLNHCQYIQNLLISLNVPTQPIAVDSNIMNDHWKKLDESTARRQLKSPRSLSGRSIHLTLVTKWSWSWPWMTYCHHHCATALRFWDTAISKFDHENSWSRSCVR